MLNTTITAAELNYLFWTRFLLSLSFLQ